MQLTPASDELAETLRKAPKRGRSVMRADDLSLAMTFCRRFKLTRAQSLLLVRLLQHGCITKEAAHSIVSRDNNPTTGIGVVGVVVGQMRKKLGRFSIGINTVRGLGFAISENDRDRLHELLAEHKTKDATTQVAIGS